MLARIKAFLHGMAEFRSSLTTHHAEDLIQAYDAGRELMHKVTCRCWEW